MLRRWVARICPRLAQRMLDHHVRLSALWLDAVERFPSAATRRSPR